MIFNVDFKDDYAHIHVSGFYTTDEAEEINEFAIQLGDYRNLKAVVVDIRKVKGPLPSSADRLKFGFQIAELQASLDPKPAFVVLGVEPMLDPDRLVELSGERAGGLLKGFSDINEAMKWIEDLPPVTENALDS